MTSFIKEMVKIIVDAGLAVLLTDVNGNILEGTNIFIGPQVEIPSGDGPYISLKQTGGFSPDESHDTKILNLGLQVIVTSSDYDLGDAKAQAIHALLDGKRSFTVTV